jgi:hypothetical protein
MMMYEFIKVDLGEIGILARPCSKKIFSSRHGY